MANSTRSKKTSSTPSSSKKRGRPPKKAQKKADIARSWSIVMFAVGILLLALAFVPGENIWKFIRENFLLGIFGIVTYIIPIVVLYIAFLTAQGKPVKMKIIQATCLVILMSGFVHIFFIGNLKGTSLAGILVELHSLGKTVTFSGGVVAGIVGAPLITLFGITPSKITITVLTVAFFMFLTDTTPYDIYVKTRDTASEQKEELSKQMEENRIARAAKQEQREILKAQQLQEKELKLSSRRKKIDFELDDKPSVDVFASDNNDLATQKTIAETFDKVRESQAIEQEKIDSIMQKLRLDNSVDYSETAVETPQAEKTMTQLEKQANTLSAQEKAEIQPLSESVETKPQEEKAFVYVHPPINLFEKSVPKNQGDVEKELKTNAQLLVDTLSSFGVQTKIIDISRGPSVTRYELQPLAGVKISKITNLADDIALNLAASGVRIEAPIPNKAAVGIEVPNKQSNAVSIRTIFEDKTFRDSQSPLTIALGVDIAGNVVVADLTRMPHLLIAGSTGSGKSVCVNAIITSFLYKSSPEDVKLILIDPKVVELAEYNGIPHLMMPVVTEPKKAAGALGSAVAEMEKRYRQFAENTVRDIKSYNKLAENNPEIEKMPYIAVVIDELADLMMVCGKEVEDYICRLAQKARAAGIHLIVATQRPSVDVITGLIKANIPARIAFAVSSQIDSRTILDGAGAEKLLGMGDMLFLPLGASKPTRVQGTYVKDGEISGVLDFIKKDFTVTYNQEMIDNMEKHVVKSDKSSDGGGLPDGRDAMLNNAIEVVVDAGQASTSLLQRRLKLGYARAARIVDEMESMGIIGPYEGSKPRQVLISRNQWLEMTMNGANED